MFFFFKQKTAYEMRISDWSSDVCSSDLGECCGNSCGDRSVEADEIAELLETVERVRHDAASGIERLQDAVVALAFCPRRLSIDRQDDQVTAGERSEERRVGKECVSTCRSRWSPSH